MKVSVLILIGLMGSHVFGASQLQCENQTNPLGIGTPNPRLSWKIDTQKRGVMQEVYRILVASSPKLLKRNQGDLWDSGKVQSAQNHLVSYAGKPLSSQQQVFWKVWTRTSDGDESESEIANWITAFLSPDEWTARWISLQGERTVDLTMDGAYWIWGPTLDKTKKLAPSGKCRLTRTFTIPNGSKVLGAELLITAEDKATAYLNGVQLTSVSGWQKGKHIKVKPLLNQGENKLEIVGVNGGDRPNPAGVVCKLKIMTDKGALTIASDERWTVASQPATKVVAWGEGAWKPSVISFTRDTSVRGLPVFTKTFSVNAGLKKALANISGLGHYELFLNGKKVGDHLLDPAWSVYEKTVYYNSFDITSLLRKGENEFRIMLGKGFYNTQGDRRVHGVHSKGQLMALLEACLTYENGKTERVVTDKSWSAFTGPITHSAILAGSDYDARIADNLVPDTIQETQCAAVLRAPESPPLKLFKPLLPIKKPEEVEPGIFVYDFGKNSSAIPAITVTGKRGHVVRITPAEQRFGQGDRYNNGTGRVNQAGVGKPNYYQYTLCGTGKERWQPQFTYGGFQYLELTGAVPQGFPNPNGLPVVELIESIPICSSAKVVGSFDCSNPLFLKINQSIDLAVRSNLSHVLTDCPTREKLGWLEVAYLMGPSISRRYDVSRLYAKVTRDIRDSQGDDGIMYTIAPNYPMFSKGFRYTPEWGAAGVIIPWQLYRWYGDRLALEENYSAMKGYVDYMKNTATDLVPLSGLGDWFDLRRGQRGGPSKFTPPELTAMATFYRCADIMSKAATELGEQTEAQTYRELAAAIRTKFNQKFYVGNGQYQNRGSCQTANAMALVCGLVEPENQQVVLDAMVEDLKKRKYQQTSGDIGFHYLVEALARFGYNQVIYRNLDRRNEGSYGFIIDRGWSALPEAWDAHTRSSMNHCMLGHAQQWFYMDVLGIRQADDSVAFKKLVIKPAFETELKWANGYYDAPNGRISVDWEKTDGTLTCSVSVPPNTTAQVYLPAKDMGAIRESGQLIKQADGVTFLKMNSEHAVLEVGSGTYRFLSIFR